MPVVRPPGKVLLAIIVAIGLLTYGSRALRISGVLDSTSYGVVLGSGLLIVTLFAVWHGLQMAPKGFATSSEKSLTLNRPYGDVCRLIPKVVGRNHWKLLEGSQETGHFKARIGMSLHTFSSTLIVDLKHLDEESVSVHAFCGTRSVNDPGHNDKMIDKFFFGLKNELRRAA